MRWDRMIIELLHGRVFSVMMICRSQASDIGRQAQLSKASEEVYFAMPNAVDDRRSRDRSYLNSYAVVYVCTVASRTHNSF